MPSNKKLLQAAAGSAGGDNLYVEDVFSTYLYTGNSSSLTINNGLDLSGEGGLVWGKRRDASGYNHVLQDTVRGAGKEIQSDLTNAQLTRTDAISSFNSNGFSFTGAGGGQWNQSGGDYASWSFRKAEKFFDVVTYTGDGAGSQAIAHNLGSTPGFIAVKMTDSADNWRCYHSSIGATGAVFLNLTNGTSTSANHWNNTAPTSTEFTAGLNVNSSGSTYVAYLFASDAGGFGEDEDENIVKCGSYTGGSAGLEVNLGFEPQWILIKRTNATDDWVMYDVMRGIPVGGDSAELIPNENYSENGYFGSSQPDINPNATGFTLQGTSSPYNNSGSTYIYIAIRRPMKTPTAGTEVFTADTRGSTGDGVNPTYRSAWPVDMALLRNVDYGSASTMLTPRLTGSQYMYANQTYAQAAANTVVVWDFMNGWHNDTGTNTAQVSWMMKRATGFMDVVAYSGNPSVAENHNLGVPPELIITKEYAHTWDWYSWGSVLGANKFVTLNSNAAATNNTFNSTVTATTFMAGIASSGQPTIAYLFATLAGVSKVGSYTGTGSDLNVDCGFTAGARFILIKRTDSTGDWYYWDYLRGITAGNDPYSILNTESAQVTGTDYVDPLNAGFTVTSSASSTVNVNGGTYLFLAIA